MTAGDFLKDWVRWYPPEMPLRGIPERDLIHLARVLYMAWACGVPLDGVPPPPEGARLRIAGAMSWREPSAPSSN